MSVQQETNGQVATDEVIQYEVEGGVATIWLNRPEVKNCINWDAADGPRRDARPRRGGRGRPRRRHPRPRQHVLRRRRPQHARLRVPRHDEQVGEDRAGLRRARSTARSTSESRRSPSSRATRSPAGSSWSISCDFAIAADDARIGDFHIRRALFGGAGPIYRLPRYIGLRKTKELLFTGKLLSGKECEEWGLANVSAPSEQLEQAIADFVAPMLDKSQFTMRITKLAANRGLDGDTETLIALESMTCNVAHQSQDAKEGVQAFLEKRDPVWKHA